LPLFFCQLVSDILSRS